MADKPINQAPEEASNAYSLYGRKNNSTNDLVQYLINQFAHAIGLSGSDRGKYFRVNSSGDVESAAAGTTSQFLGWDGSGDLVAKAVPSEDFFHARGEFSSGTAGGASVTGWQTTPINTVKINGITGASLASNVITLPAGTYDVEAMGEVIGASAVTRLRLYNVTDAAVIETGINNQPAGSNKPQLAFRFTLAGTKNVRLETYTDVATATQGLGQARSLGTEVYAEIFIRKVVS